MEQLIMDLLIGTHSSACVYVCVHAHALIAQGYNRENFYK